MELQQLITPLTQTTDIKLENTGINMDFFTKGGEKAKVPVTHPEEEQQTKKRGRPPKSENSVYVGAAEEEGQAPYSKSYEETQTLLKQTIGQIDTLGGELKKDIDDIRASKTLKSKYTYLSEMTGTSGSLLGQKIAAIREINSSISKGHDLEIKRMKDLNMAAGANEDKNVMDLYNMFLQNPISQAGSINPGLSSIEMVTAMNSPNMIMSPGIASVEDAGYNTFIQNMTPEQNRMMMEGNPNIQTVVVFNQDTGERMFDVIDKGTGQSIPNVPRPDQFLFENINIDVRNRMARDTKLDTIYPLVVLGSGSMSEY